MSQPLPLWSHLPVLLQRCVAHAWCALCLDYDGTLAPLVADPATACLSATMRHVLAALLQHPRYLVAIVSGRSLTDLRTRIDCQVPYLAGNHGLELVGPETAYCHPDAQRLRSELLGLADTLQRGLAEFPGVWVEDKGLTLTVHWRRVPPVGVPVVQRRVLCLVRPALEARQVILRAGKDILEVRPQVPWDKGDAVRWIVTHMHRSRPGTTGFVMYMGDDETDEDAFRAVRTTGAGIVVGHARRFSSAHYALDSVEQTAQFLALCHSVRWPTTAT